MRAHSTHRKSDGNRPRSQFAEYLLINITKKALPYDSALLYQAQIVILAAFINHESS